MTPRDAKKRDALAAFVFEHAAALFPRDDLRLFDTRPVRFRCKCSVASVARALQIAPGNRQ